MRFKKGRDGLKDQFISLIAKSKVKTDMRKHFLWRYGYQLRLLANLEGIRLNCEAFVNIAIAFAQRWNEAVRKWARSFDATNLASLQCLCLFLERIHVMVIEMFFQTKPNQTKPPKNISGGKIV